MAGGAKRPLPLVGESAESRFARADNSGPSETQSCSGDCSCDSHSSRQHSPSDAQGRHLSHRLHNGYKICREWSCSHDKCSDPCPRQLSHVCIRPLQPPTGVVPCAAATQSRSCHKVPKQLEVTLWWRYANATRCRDASWSLQPCGCLLGFGSLFDAVLRYNDAVSQPTEGTAAVALCRSVSWQPNRSRLASVGLPARHYVGDGGAVTSMIVGAHPPDVVACTFWAGVEVAVVAERVRRLVCCV